MIDEMGVGWGLESVALAAGRAVLFQLDGGGMLGDSGFAVFVSRECCVGFSKVLKFLDISPDSPPYTASRNYYAAALLYKLSYAYEDHTGDLY